MESGAGFGMSHGGRKACVEEGGSEPVVPHVVPQPYLEALGKGVNS